MVNKIVLMIMVLSIMGLASAAINIQDSENPNIFIKTPTQTYNNATAYVNSSNFWGTYLWTNYNMPLILSLAYNHTSITQAWTILNFLPISLYPKLVLNNQSNTLNGNQTINGNLTMNGNIAVNGNVTLVEDFSNYPINYLRGYPLAGDVGSGIIWAKSLTSRASLNITYSGLAVTYPNFTVRLAYTNGSTKYCNIAGATVNVPDNANTIYYVDRSCAVQNTPIATYVQTDVSPGGVTDFFNVMAHSNTIEQISGTSLLQKVEVKDRQRLLQVDNMKVINGFQITLESQFRNFTINSGQFQYVRDIVTASKQNTSTGANVEWVYHNGVGTFGFTDGKSLNISTCDNGTGIEACTTGTGSNTKYRRHFIFITGFNDTSSGVDNSEIHQLLPLLNTFYQNPIDCSNTLAYPVTYTMPPEYQYANVLLYAYCARADDTSWVAEQLIDLRTSKTGTATAQAITESDPVFTAQNSSLAHVNTNNNFNNNNLTQIGTMNASFFQLNSIGNTPCFPLACGKFCRNGSGAGGMTYYNASGC